MSTQQAAVVALVLSVGVAASAGVACAVSGWLDQREFASFGSILSRVSLQEFGGGLLVGMLAAVSAVAYLVIGGNARLATTPTEVGTRSTSFLFIAAVLLYLTVNVVSEELIFRRIVLGNFVEGLTSRSLDQRYVALLAVAASALVFGVWHPISPGAGGGIDTVLTSAGVGVLLGTAYLLSGRLSFPVGIHLGGGLVLVTLTQQQLFGYALPTVVELEQLTGGPEVTYGILFARVASGLCLVCLWVYLTRGKLSFDDRVFSQETKANDPRKSRNPTAGND
ncbi:hypothetical protein AUR64_09690 [Haloprofundus marisrubri]|uniref:CAAX prenyl protease 2/Lysostaphin resistance protein A-like domain-containing protein n=1 Tax=Haloprofundus marisrubri TaxID=1514971 RepID=A0A0W1R9I6_9EURY|nr:CPBP family intramembrane glutamic endopeptidase [Haloprofundus marisrubri]KTG09888.1 hypothetical protein AUR64_09690 [Haloprofundus marisrubri]